MNRALSRAINARLRPDRIQDLETRKAILTLQESSRRAYALEEAVLQDVSREEANYSPNVSKEAMK